MKKLVVIPVALAMLTLAGCETTGDSPFSKQNIGTVGGAVVGGVMGSRFGEGEGKLVATGIGTLLGAWAGSEIGKSLDRADRIYADQAASQAYVAPIGETINWSNPESGHGGSVTPVREGRSSNDEYCREYKQTISIDDRSETAFGVACQQPDGSWRIVN